MATNEESATVSEGEGEGLQEKRVDRRGLGTEAGAIGVRKVGATATALDSPMARRASH